MSLPNRKDNHNPAEPSLGKGLDSLFGGEISALSEPKGMTTLPINLLKPGRFQPRKNFPEVELKELSASIAKHGILHPLLVRTTSNEDAFGNELYEIIAGERRFRAAKLAGLSRVPVVVRPMSDAQAAEGSLIENIQRQDLNPIEEARAYHRLAEEFNYKHEDLSTILGKSRSHISNMLRLLMLPEKIQNFLIDGHLTVGHAKVLATVDNSESLAEKAVSEKLSVRALEAQIALQNPKKGKASKLEPINVRGDIPNDCHINETTEVWSEDLKSIEGLLSEKFGHPAEIDMHKDKSGKICFPFRNSEEFDLILQKFMGS